ncbi:MAG: acetate--CoA ligase family protein [Ardenticatenia bacterium]|nr:acetate--CoA ligase family protein [Ardenticatenia bacterium]MBK8540829.1 acetate--CoA ligase family protein [Ardenticatenia bacterium]
MPITSTAAASAPAPDAIAAEAPLATSAELRHLMAPRRVAVIGASRDRQKIGGAIFHNLLDCGFTGAVFPVNPKAEAVAGVLAYPTVADIPGAVDLAVVVVPAAAVMAVVAECAAKKVSSVVVISAGFAETGEAGRALQNRLTALVRSSGMRMIGPNCVGILNTDPAVSLNASFAARAPLAGRIAMASQSGALGVALLDQAKAMGLGVAQFVSLGNRADISSNDLLAYWAADERTDVILLYLESFGNTRNFARIARQVTRIKPVVALRGGRSSAGARAAASHTGSLAGPSAGLDALLRQTGVLQVDSIEDMFGVSQVMAYQPPPRGRRLAIVTNAGGPGILAADACAVQGLRLATLSPATRTRLAGFLPPEASTQNPVDMIASATPEAYRQAVEAVLADEGVDSVLMIFIEPLVTRPEPVAEAIRTAVAGTDKTVLACFMMARGAPELLRLGEGRRVPSFIFPEDAIRALALATAHAERTARPAGHAPELAGLDRAAARRRLAAAREAAGPDGWLTPDEVLGLMADYGIAALPTAVVSSAEEAAAAAARLGLPAALKLRSRVLTHKTDVGGVRLRLGSAEEVATAYRDMAAQLAELGQGAAMDGALVQPMQSMDQSRELILGMSRDPQFGPVLMLGLGGVQVEILRDVAFALPPLLDTDPDLMLETLKGKAILAPWRGWPAADLPALRDAVLRFAALVEDLPELTEIEVNPLLVLPEGRGVMALDGRAKVG